MNLIKASAFLAAISCAALQTQAAIRGQWDFSAGSLAATAGQPLEYLDGVAGATEQQTVFGTTASLGLPPIGGQAAGVMGFPRSLPAMGYVMRSNMEPNGGGAFVNQYTVIFDLLYTGDSANAWRALMQIDEPSNANDADFFINPNGAVGISGQYQGSIKSNTWHRVAIAVDLAAAGGGQAWKYVDGQLVAQQSLGVGIDSRWAISPSGGQFGDAVLLFTDDNADGGSNAPGFVNSIQAHDKTLSPAYLAVLGAPQGDAIPATVQVPVTIASRRPGTNAFNILPGSQVNVSLALGSEAFDSGTIALKLNGQPLAATLTPGDGSVAIAATLPQLPSRSQNTLQLVWSDPAAGGSVTQQWSFSVAPYALDPALAASLGRGVAAYWKLDEALTNANATAIHDIARGNDSTLVAADPAAAWRTGADARFGSALYLDENATVTISTNEALNIKTNQVTLAAWVKLDLLPSELSEGIGGIYDSVEDGYVIYLDRGNRELRFKVTDAAGQAARPGIPEAQLTKGEWLSVIAVYDGKASATAGQARIYLNGQLADTHTGNDGGGGVGLTNVVRAGQAAALGRNGVQTASFLHGAVDDVAVWERALTIDEIGYLASGHAVPVTGPLTVPATVSSRFPAAAAVNVLPGTILEFVLAEGSAPIDTNSIVITINGAAATATYSEQAGAISARTTIGRLPPRSRVTVRAQWNDPAVGGIVGDEWSFTMGAYGDDPALEAGLQASLVANWKMDDGLTDVNSAILADSAGANDAALTLVTPENAWLGEAAARFGGALYLGENYADVPVTDALNITNRQVSISAWVKLELLPSQMPEGFGAIFDSVEDDYVLYLDRNNRELRFKVTDASGQAARPGIPEARLATNEWLHVAAVFDATARPAAGEARIYLNGQLADLHPGNDGSVGAGLTNTVRGGQTAAIGKNGVQTVSHFLGAVDDLAVWSRALTVEEVGYLAAGHAVRGAGADSVRIGSITVQGQTVRITWAGKPGNYQLQRRASLGGGAWENAGPATTSPEAQDTVSGQSMFYRVLVQ